MTHVAGQTPITVVIPTRDRGDRVVNTVRSLLANSYPAFSATVVDQSADDRTETSLKPLLGDRRVRYLRTSTRGLSAGLNVGIDLAASELIAITGDDCTVPANWLSELATAFESHPGIAIVFGNVLPASHDCSVGFVPSYVRDDEFLARHIHDKHRLGGTSACMGIKRSVWHTLGGFDQVLGAGSPLHSAEDTDLTIRALLGGHAVYETPRVSVVHHGFYPSNQHAMLVHRYWYGTGAAFAKQVKCGRWSVVAALARLAVGWARGRPRAGVRLVRRPGRLPQLSAFARGALAGAATPVDRATGLFVAASRR